MIPWAKIIIGDSRKMVEINWHIKDYGKVGQIGYSETLHGIK
jgi:hypothetical protein